MNRVQSIKIVTITGSFSKEEIERKSKDKISNQKIARQKDELSCVLKKLQINNLAIIEDIRLVSIIHTILKEDDIDILINLLNTIAR